MITNKDIRVENGNLVLNGDKFPLDGQSPEAIMEIVEDNSDTTPTENSTAPITSGGVYNTIGDLTQTGVSGASVADQIAVIGGQIGSLNFALFEVPFDNFDISTAWGTALYISASKSIDISSLALVNRPKAVYLSAVASTSTVMIVNDTVTATSIPFYFARPNSNTGVSANVSALVIY